MLGTFSFELQFKSYCLITFRSLKFWKFRLGPCLLPQHASLLCFPPPVPCAARPPRWDAPGQIQLRLRFTWRHHELLDPAPYALVPPPFATPPPKLRAAATATPPWRARCSTKDPQFACDSEPRAPHPFFFPHLFGLSPLRKPRTAPPPRSNSDELHPAVAPPFQNRSTQIDHANSFAST